GIVRSLDAVDPEDVPRVRQLDVLGREPWLRGREPRRIQKSGAARAGKQDLRVTRKGTQRRGVPDRERGTGGAGHVEMRDRNRRQAREPAAWSRAFEVLGPERQHAGRRRRHRKDDVRPVTMIEKNLSLLIVEVEAA